MKTSRRSRYAVLMAALLALVLLAGCGGAPAGGSGGSGDGSLDRVKQAGKLVIGVDDAYAPMEFRDDAGNIVGFDVDMMAEVGKRLGVSVEWQPTAWDGIIPALVAQNFDLIVSSMNITEDRQKEVNFSDPYLHMGQVLIVAKGNPKAIQTLDDMKGQTFAVQIGTTNETAARAVEGANVITYDTFPQAMEDVAAGRADATIADSPIGKYYLVQNPGKGEAVGAEIDPLPVGIAIRKEDNQLREAINKALKEMQDDGTMDKLKAQWFGN